MQEPDVHVGVTAAINEAAFQSNKIIIPAAMVIIFLFVTLFYWSLHAGWLMFLASRRRRTYS